MSKLMKKIVTGMLALAMVLGTIISVSGATGLQPGTVANVTKILEVPTGVSTPALEFDYKVEAVSVDGVTATASNMPAIPDRKISFVAGDAKDGTSATGAVGYDTVTKVQDFIAGISFPHAGEYIYNITETVPGTPGDVTYSLVAYQMTVYVENNGSLTSVAVTNVGFKQIKSATGATIAAEDQVKADPIFINRFDKTVDFVVDKTVAGDFADTTYPFDYTLVVTRPDGVNAVAKDYVGTIFDTDGTTDVGTVTVSFAANAPTATVTGIKLAHNQTLKFLPADKAPTATMTGLPAGATYVLTENLSSTDSVQKDYTPSVSVVINSDSPATLSGSLGTSLTIGDGSTATTAPLNAPINLGEGVNSASWTNTHQLVTPTGILLNNLPFILLIVVAVGGFVGYIASKRRKASN